MSPFYKKLREYKECKHIEISTVLSKKNKEYNITWRCSRCNKQFVPKEDIAA